MVTIRLAERKDAAARFNSARIASIDVNDPSTT